MPKRGENIYRRKDGRWEGRIRQPEALPAGGNKYRSVYGKTYSEVKRKMEEAKREPGHTRTCQITLEEAVEIWYADKKDDWKESTYALYRQIVEKDILPRLGGISLEKIDRLVMNDFAEGIQTEHSGRKLSKAHLSYICGMVLRIMSHARKKLELPLEIPENPVDMERKPRMTLPEERELSRLEAYLLQNLPDDVCLGILVALHTGLRIGELCALTWENIDLEAGILHVRNNIQRVKDYGEPGNRTRLLVSSPKTVCSVRDIPIPPVLASVLQSCRKEPGQPLMKGVRGIWLDPRTLQYRFRRILELCDIPYFKFHTLRHIFATRCIEKGFDSESLSEILGHSSIQITLNLYVHSTLQQKRRLMNLMEMYSR